MENTALQVVQGAVETEAPKLWKNADGKKYSEQFVYDWVSSTKLDRENTYQVIVGTDSHMHGHAFRFITVVCVYRVGKGGNFYYLETYEPRENYVQGARGKKVKGNQKMRMFVEVEKSIALADDLFSKTEVLPIVHIDASPFHKGEFTSAFSDQLKGYVTGAGYECVLKPDSWAANAVADKFTK